MTRGTTSPLFLLMTLNRTDEIKQIAAKALGNESLFVVEVKVSVGTESKVTVIIDGDHGVTIDDCAKTSRAIGLQIESDDLILGSYTLNVMSAGIDSPLTLERQYKKNVGRRVRVKNISGELTEGTLKEYGQESITLSVGKKKDIIEKTIRFDEIDWIKVLVSFK